MHLGKVIGRVNATVKDDRLEGVKLLIVQPIDHELKEKEAPLVAVDPLHAGTGDMVEYVVGREAMLGLDVPNACVDAGIVAIVDSLNVEQ
ncbi:MAG: EutN/CcmL family microcompartment protein [Nitrospinae bacterium]|nr:EutN/CcmL family microcompartment protein [Nitrospinota bacterium]